MIKKIFTLFLILIPINSYALIEVDITRGNLDPLPVAVSPLSIDEKSKTSFQKALKKENIGEEISSIVENNLRTSGLFNPLSKEAFLQAPDERPLSLSYASIAILNSLNQWEQLAPYSTPIKRVRVSQQSSFGQLEFAHHDLKLPFLGQVVPYFKLHQTLYSLVPHENIIQYKKI